MLTERRLNASSLAKLLGDWRESATRERTGVAAALEGRLSLLIRDGRLPFGTRLPPEREFARALGSSRTTVAAVYDALRAAGQIESRRGAGSWVTTRHVPGRDDATPWYPGGIQHHIDLTHAALPAPSEIFPALVDRAVQASTRYTNGHGYHLFGLPELRDALAQRFTARGLPTQAGQILITAGAQSALALSLAVSLHPGARVLVDHPTYPNAFAAIRYHGGRCIPIDLDAGGWNTERWYETAREARPDLMYCVPDFHNPTGLVMPAECRKRLSDVARLSGCPLIVDEALADMAVDEAAPLPLARYAHEGAAVITVGSLSKIFWGGLRIGWVRAPEAVIAKVAAVKAALDMASPVFEQLLALGVLAELPALMALRREQLRVARDTLLSTLAATLPAWRTRVPAGGPSAWIDLGAPLASRLAEESRRHGVAVTPGTLFGLDGAFEDHLRIPYTLDAERSRVAIRRLANAWHAVRSGPGLSAEQTALTV